MLLQYCYLYCTAIFLAFCYMTMFLSVIYFKHWWTMRLFHRSRRACYRWVSLDQRGMSWAGQKRYTHLKAHETDNPLCLCVASSCVYSFFLKVREEFLISSHFAASVSSANSQMKATRTPRGLLCLELDWDFPLWVVPPHCVLLI